MFEGVGPSSGNLSAAGVIKYQALNRLKRLKPTKEKVWNGGLGVRNSTKIKFAQRKYILQ